MATSLTALARYSRTAAWLHWIIAALVLINLLLGFLHEDFDRATRSMMMNVHKATGLTVLALTLARLGWRIAHRPPPFDPVMRSWEVGLARVIHGLFYLLLIALPVTGWMLSSSSGRPTVWYGLFEIAPLPVSRSDDAHDLFEEMHELLAYGAIALILLHVAGALKHHLQGHRHLIGRMAPWGYRGG